jgi:Tfp pilus assembly protein PilE
MRHVNQRSPAPMKRPAQRREGGFTLISVLIACVMMGIFMMGFMSFTLVQSKSEHNIMAASDLLDIRQYIETNFSCDNTVAVPITCGTPTSFVEIKAQDKSTLVALPSGTTTTIIGMGYHLRALCITCADSTCTNGKRLQIQVAKMDSDGVSPLDPLNRMNPNWIDLLHNVPLACVVP